MNRVSGPDRPGGEHTEHDRTVVAALASLVPLTGPTAAERDRIRERVLAGLAETADPGTAQPVAVAERAPAVGSDQESSAVTTAVADDATAATDRVRPTAKRVASGRVARASRGPRGRRGVSRSGGRDDRPADPARPLSGARARLAVAAVAVLALVGSLAGMSLLLARDALPGDALYGFKRTAEAASLGLAFGDESKALKHLDFAAARISEIETLARQNPDNAPVGNYLTALTDLDNDAAAGSRGLIALATRADASRLELLATWSRQQRARLSSVALPAAVRSREAASAGLLDKIAGRADALRDRMGCYRITSGSFDDIGALPATGTCEPVPGADPAPPSPAGPSGSDPTGAPAPGTGGQGAPEPGTGPTAEGATPALPPLPGVASLLPVPERTGQAEPGAGGTQDPAPAPTLVLPLPLPGIEVPPLLPGLPGVRVGE